MSNTSHETDKCQPRSTIPVEIIYADERFHSDEPEHDKFIKFTYGSKGAAAIDIIACNTEPVLIRPGERIKIETGVKMWLNDINVGAFMLPRSGIGADYGIVLGNLTGLIDSDFQGMMKIPLWNSNSSVCWCHETKEPSYNEAAEFVVNPGDRICQMTLLRLVHGDYQEVAAFSGVTVRGEGGFGSTKGIDNAEVSDWDSPSLYKDCEITFTATSVVKQGVETKAVINGYIGNSTCFAVLPNGMTPGIDESEFPCKATLKHRLDFATTLTLHTSHGDKDMLVSINDIPHVVFGDLSKVDDLLSYRIGGTNFTTAVDTALLYGFDAKATHKSHSFLVKQEPHGMVSLDFK